MERSKSFRTGDRPNDLNQACRNFAKAKFQNLKNALAKTGFKALFDAFLDAFLDAFFKTFLDELFGEGHGGTADLGFDYLFQSTAS